MSNLFALTSIIGTNMGQSLVVVSFDTSDMALPVRTLLIASLCLVQATVVCIGDVGKLVLNLGNTCGNLVSTSIKIRLLDFLGFDLLLQSSFVFLESLLCCLKNFLLATVLLLNLLLTFGKFRSSVKVLQLLSKLLGVTLCLGLLGFLLTNLLPILFVVVSGRGELIVRCLIVLSQGVGAGLVFLSQILETEIIFAKYCLNSGNLCS